MTRGAKIAVTAGAILGVTALAAIVTVRAWFDDMCANEVTDRVTSPEGDFEAVIFVRNCGATVDFSTQLSIVPIAQELPNGPGNTYIVGHRFPVAATWEGSRALLVERQTPGLKEEELVAGVAIRYARLEPPAR